MKISIVIFLYIAIDARKMTFKHLNFPSNLIYIFKYGAFAVRVTHIFEYIKGQDWHAICGIHFVEAFSLCARKSLAIRSRNDSSDVLCCRYGNSGFVITIQNSLNETGFLFASDSKKICVNAGNRYAVFGCQVCWIRFDSFMSIFLVRFPYNILNLYSTSTLIVISIANIREILKYLMTR